MNKNNNPESDGTEFWDSLPPEQQALSADKISTAERWLTQYFPPPQTSVHALTARRLSLEMGLTRQFDMESCTFIATANGLRVLDQPKAEYSLTGLQDRVSRTYGHQFSQLDPNTLEAILKSGAPFDQFKLSLIPKPLVSDRPVPIDMYCLLRKFQEGAVAVLNWPYSSAYTYKRGKYFDHARTLTGFTSNQEGLFFHILDPYTPREIVYSFRDLIVACLYQHEAKNRGIGAADIDSVAQRSWILEKPKTAKITSL